MVLPNPRVRAPATQLVAQGARAVALVEYQPKLDDGRRSYPSRAIPATDVQNQSTLSERFLIFFA